MKMAGSSGLYFFTLLITVVFGGSSDSNINKCFNVKDYYWKHMSSKTPYRFVANTDDSEIYYEGCVPKKIWMIIRHGTRYPEDDVIIQMNSRLIEIRNEICDNPSQKKHMLCETHMNNITEWTPQVDLANEKTLAPEGEKEMKELAKRFQNRFPSLLKVKYTNSSFYFKHTETQRTKQSKYYFTVGLFETKVAQQVWSPKPIYKDPVLRFYKLCQRWIKDVDKNPNAKVELDKFKNSDKVKKVVKNIALRLDYKDISFDDVELMYLACSYESSWNPVAFSPWCSVFSEEDMQVIEFQRDLKYYWKDGYGFDINFKQACPLMEDFLRHVESKDGPTSLFYFTHSGTILKFLSHLGLYYDEFRLTHDKFKRPRLWRASHIDAFGSNIALITFQCGNEMKLLTLHQERPVTLPGCPKGGLCRFDKVLKVYKNSFTNCKFSDICKVFSKDEL